MSMLPFCQELDPAPLRDNGSASRDLFAGILDAHCPRTRAMLHTEGAARLARFVEAGAWTDAALTLLALELPRWQLRRLAYEDGEWHCTLSNNRDMPDWLDATVETHHADMALAILNATVEVRREPPQHLQVTPARAAPDPLFDIMGCDNYA